MARALILVFLLVATAVVFAGMAAEAAPLHANANANALNSHRSAFEKIARSVSDKIKHIVVLMMENRSFDHMFGFYGKDKGVNGLTGKEYNLLDINNPASKKIYVDDKAPHINKCDPNHGLNGTTAKIYGSLARGYACNFTCEDMSGFAQFEKANNQSEYCNVMQSLNNAPRAEGGTLPVLTALADEFVLMDRFFCSVPGPTWPNRLFHLAATSGGDTSTGPWYHNVPGNLYPHKTILDQVDEAGGQWKIYYNDTPWEMMMSSVAFNADKLHPMETFYEDCKEGSLPDYSFINPRVGINVTTGIGANDQHPDHDVRAGEQFYKDVYEAVRASPQWKDTLLIITYDEHGGFYDHVPPPLNAPVPNHETSYPSPFAFDRLGVRIPTLLISPWVQKGAVVSRAPEAQRPAENSEYDLTSIMASARKILRRLEGAPALTRRDAWASTFEHVLEALDEPRTDCPMHLPDPEPPTPNDLAEEAQQPINDLQADILAVHHVLANPNLLSDAMARASSSSRLPSEGYDVEEYPKALERQADVGAYLQQSFAAHKARTLRWRASKAAAQQQNADVVALSGSPIPKTVVGFAPNGRLPHVALFEWDVRKSTVKKASLTANPNGHLFDDAANAKADFFVTLSGTLRGREGFPDDKVCLDAPKAVAGANLSVSVCYPSADPNTNRDAQQQFYWAPDSSIRPIADDRLCVTTDGYKDRSENGKLLFNAYLAPCDPSNVYQRHGYDGDAPGARPSNSIWTGALYFVVAMA